MMNFSEYLGLIERGLGYKNIGTFVSSKRYKILKPFLERELDIILPLDNPYKQSYNDLWNIINSKLEEKTSRELIISNSNINIDSEVLFPEKEGSSIIPISIEVAKKIKEVSGKIADDKKSLKNKLDTINNTKPIIDIASYLGVIPKKDDIETTFDAVLSFWLESFKECGTAIQKTNDNMSNMLELFRLLIKAEVGIYHLLDNQSIQSNELHELIKEWCVKHGIHDKEVDKLLESSFQRAYTLRDRINTLRDNFDEKFEHNSKAIKEQKETLDRIDKLVNESLTKTEEKTNALEKSQEEFISQSNEQTSQALEALGKKREEDTKAIQNELKKSLDRIDKLVNESLTKAEEKTEALVKSQEEFISQSNEQTSQALEALGKKREEDTKALQNELKESLDRIDKLVNDNLTKAEEKTNALVKSQEEFVSQSKEQTSLALSEFQKEAKHKTTEIQEQTDGFIENQNALFEKMKKQLVVYKVVSVVALFVSLFSLLYALM